MVSKRSFGHKVESFLTSVTVGEQIPDDIEVLRPYSNPEVQHVVHRMCERYYAGNQPRIAVWGINPGRFGAGLTGLAFTDPHAVSSLLGIATTLQGRRELSAEFMQGVIETYGGPETFYRSIYLTGVCPLGFVKRGVNINFYDDAELQQQLVPTIVKWVEQQIDYGIRIDHTVVLGTGKLKQFFERNIRLHCGFEDVTYLEHPRYIMQYRRKERETFTRYYVDTLRRIANE